MTRRKPRGEQGHLSLGSDRPAIYTIDELPLAKEALEECVLERAATAVAEGSPFLEVFTRAGRTIESDFDFTAQTSSGEQFLELMEFAPLYAFGGSYRGLPVSYVQGPMADLYVEMLTRKSRKYGASSYDALHLLTYCTDHRLRLSDGVLAIAAIYLARNEHAFRSIHHIVPKATGPQITCVYPNQQLVIATDEPSLRRKAILQADFRRMTASDDGSAEVPLQWPPWNGQRPKKRRRGRARGRKPR